MLLRRASQRKRCPNPSCPQSPALQTAANCRPRRRRPRRPDTPSTCPASQSVFVTRVQAEKSPKPHSGVQEASFLNWKIIMFLPPVQSSMTGRKQSERSKSRSPFVGQNTHRPNFCFSIRPNVQTLMIVRQVSVFDPSGRSSRTLRKSRVVPVSAALGRLDASKAK
jgi:hypothetical protein